jgi:hypothetical protein
MAGKQLLVGVENVEFFSGSSAYEAFGKAREAAKAYAGIGNTQTVLFIQKIGPYKGRILASQNKEGTRGWRIDFDPHGSKGLHINWWDYSADPKRQDKSKWKYGANCVQGGTQDLFWEIVSHFPQP